MKQVRDFFQASLAFLEKKEVLQPKRSVEELLAATLGIKRMDVYLQFERPMNEEEVSVLRNYVSRRAKGEPIEHILQYAAFHDMVLHVSSDVLIPRPETELLLHFLKKDPIKPTRILDICTGSGCIALALKKMYPDAEVVATDISEEAVAVAKKNADKLGLDVSFLLGDLTEPVLSQQFDLIISNPPYISKNEYDGLSPEVRDYEPQLALLGGEDGLEFYRRLEKEIQKIAMPNAKVIFEIGYKQAQSLQEIYSGEEWVKKGSERDWSGNDRFFFLEFAGETR